MLDAAICPAIPLCAGRPAFFSVTEEFCSGVIGLVEKQVNQIRIIFWEDGFLRERRVGFAESAITACESPFAGAVVRTMYGAGPAIVLRPAGRAFDLRILMGGARTAATGRGRFDGREIGFRL